ncbi:MAG: hypothetical protein UU82_C0025G0007 [Candidatus Nomurabacteria bacterium GW2011_GWC2_41_8]|uniref:Uncharacterized protein n=1 Tax=Candidatus Nomurabacteria bacterium GW2011_GWC2_41_8 TaxID=1618755 RepID=A0A0G0XFF8_9BACT|nr:MAG: hypothetical protein UU82_C0025G0007 [Candidatus Nomurabacteria bacterium GW2011_GWC2_41_8]
MTLLHEDVKLKATQLFDATREGVASRRGCVGGYADEDSQESVPGERRNDAQVARCLGAVKGVLCDPHRLYLKVVKIFLSEKALAAFSFTNFVLEQLFLPLFDIKTQMFISFLGSHAAAGGAL